MVVINIQRYNDFDIVSTIKLMIAPAIYSKAAAKGLAHRLAHENKDTDNVDGVIKELKNLGFIEVQNVELTLGGDL